METKQAQSYLSKINAYTTKSNNCEIVNSRKLINLLPQCKIRAKNQHNQRKQQQQSEQNLQQQQQQQQLCFNDKDLQQFPWYLKSKNIMFSYPRRRKLYENKRAVRQGQNFTRMLHFTDILPDEHLNAMKFDSFMLKSSSIATKMWH